MPPMDEPARFSMQQTLVFMCRDLIEDISEMRSFENDRDALEETTAIALSLTSYDRETLASLGRIIDRMATKTYTLFAKHYDDPVLDSLLKRILSLKDICSNLLE